MWQQEGCVYTRFFEDYCHRIDGINGYYILVEGKVTTDRFGNNNVSFEDHMPRVKYFSKKMYKGPEIYHIFESVEEAMKNSTDRENRKRDGTEYICLSCGSHLDSHEEDLKCQD